MNPVTTGVLLLGELPATELASLACRIEEWGYDYLWLADERFFREVYSSLTLCALNTSRIKLGPCVTDPYSRHPALTAQAIGTLDEISGGRAVLGIGAGISGFAELGIARSRPALAIREAVTLIRALMRGEEVDFQGRTVEFKGGGLNFPPLRPDVPIYIASNSPLGLQLAGEVADGVIISSCATQATVDYSLGIISEGASRTGRDIVAIDRVARLNCCIAADPQEALQGVKMSAVRSLSTYTRFAIAAGLEVPPDLTEAIAQLGYTHDTQKLESLARQAPDDLIRDATLAGTIDEVTAKVVSMIESGITQVTIRPSPTPRQGIATTLETFATQVMPQVREQLR